MGESFLEATFGGWDRGVKMAQNEADFTLRQYALQQAAQQHQMQMAKMAQEVIASQRQMANEDTFKASMQPSRVTEDVTTQYGNNPEMVPSDWNAPMQGTAKVTREVPSPSYSGMESEFGSTAARLAQQGVLRPQDMYHFREPNQGIDQYLVSQVKSGKLTMQDAIAAKQEYTRKEKPPKMKGWDKNNVAVVEDQLTGDLTYKDGSPYAGGPLKPVTEAQPLYGIVQTSEGVGKTSLRSANADVTPVGGRPISTNEAGELSAYDSIVNSAEKLKKLYKPEYVGPIAGRAGYVAAKTGIGLKSGQATFQASSAETKRTVFDTGGKALTQMEWKILAPYYPDDNMPPEVWKAAMDNFIDKTKELRDTKEKRLQGSGYGVGGSTPSGVKKRLKWTSNGLVPVEGK